LKAWHLSILIAYTLSFLGVGKGVQTAFGELEFLILKPGHGMVMGNFCFCSYPMIYQENADMANFSAF
ncbi:MAG: hypothetical protein KDD69_20495, partial [Bdellovibrionales bacterium]|nr:hypothetical protein [Bdellovibrionales bacterium]